MDSPKPAPKYVALNDALYDYVARHRSHAVDPVLDELRAETEALGEIAAMLISGEQGDLMTMLTKLHNVRCAVEVGTFTGYSSICVARGLSEGGRLFCFDLNADWTAIAQRYWKKDGAADRIELHLGDAKEKLKTWQPPQPIDLAFIDADKPGYDTYYELLLPKMKPNGLFIFDNMVWDGRLLQKPLTHPDGIALDRLNDKLASDPRVESVLLPVADGLHLARKR
ncbi:MAG: class I SAM-dependent methyltransferase [Verrucomicrobiota bacterium]|nr:class I SAM-dependent methyltransferase [Verrucomicrobiota bacterium]